MHARLIKYYSDASHDVTTVLLYALSSETGMETQLYLQLEELNGKILVPVHWRGFPLAGETLEAFLQIPENLSRILFPLL